MYLKVLPLQTGPFMLLPGVERDFLLKSQLLVGTSFPTCYKILLPSSLCADDSPRVVE